MTVTEREAFEAMFGFLVEVYERTQSNEFASLLGSMSLLPDGKPVDPATWSDWLDCLQRAKRKEIQCDLGLG